MLPELNGWEKARSGIKPLWTNIILKYFKMPFGEKPDGIFYGCCFSQSEKNQSVT